MLDVVYKMRGGGGGGGGGGVLTGHFVGSHMLSRDLSVSLWLHFVN